jgi:DNA primase small subunit
MRTQSFIKQQFDEFYKENSKNIKAPLLIEQREFGFLTFTRNVMVRHKSYKSVENLRSYIKKVIPAHVYYSTAYYELPKANMREKGWLGADLFFDIDSDHLITKCGKVHDTWICRNCSFIGKGIMPETCPSCHSKRFQEKKWPCEVCLETTKSELTKLVDILINDFGFSSENIKVSFSGHRGYHLHINSKTIQELESNARKEIVDYITGIGLNKTYHGDYKISMGSDGLSRAVGWQGRIEKGVYEFISSASTEDLKNLGLSKKVVDEIISIKKIDPSRIKIKSKESLEKIISRAIINQASHIDTVVTTDIHRLIRMPNSLHGKTGWMKISFPINEIETFDPLEKAIAFKKGEALIYVEEAPEFRLGEEMFGPFKQEKVELPMAAALFLLCKGAAKVMD